MQVRLCLLAALGNEVAHHVVKTALHAVTEKVEIVEIQIGAVIASERDGIGKVPLGDAEMLLDQPMQRHHAQPKLVDQAQVRRQRNVIVASVFCAGNINGVVGEDRCAHASDKLVSEQDTGLPSNRRHRGWLWIAAAVLVLIAAMGWWWLRVASNATSVTAEGGVAKGAPVAASSRNSKLGDSDHTAIANRASGLVHTGSTGRRDNQRKPYRFDRTAAVTDVVKALLPLAQAGDTEVMYELGFRLSTCRNHLDRDEVSVRSNALREFFDQNGHEPKTDDELSVVAMMIDGDTTMLGSCRGLDPALMATSIDWIERAARAGDIDALLWYQSSALEDMRSREDILMNLDEVARRRELARGFMRTALDRGACDVLLLYSMAYGGRAPDFNWVFKADPYLSLVYAEAAVHAGLAGHFDPQTLTGVSDPARRAAAAAQGAALAAQHCGRQR